jgi:plasmid stabilization system protein ParE
VTRRSVIVSNRAQRQIAAARLWWRSNRDKAPDAFDDDVDATLLLLAENALIGERHASARQHVRRVHVPRIRYYFYYRVLNGTIKVLQVRHASRRPPKRL